MITFQSLVDATTHFALGAFVDKGHEEIGSTAIDDQLTVSTSTATTTTAAAAEEVMIGTWPIVVTSGRGGSDHGFTVDPTSPTTILVFALVMMVIR